MKTIFALFAGVLVLASCSAPKYTYHFDYYDYNSGKKKAETENVVATELPATLHEISESPLKLDEKAVVATAETLPGTTPEKILSTEKVASENILTAGKNYKAMTRAEKKEFRKALKSEIKNYVKTKKAGEGLKSVADTKAMDYNLKMAIIFGAVALTLSFFGGVNTVFWVISVVSLVVGVVFFIKWIAEQ